MFQGPKLICNQNCFRDRIKNFNLADIKDSSAGKTGNFVWTFMRTNGHSITWVVPFFSVDASVFLNATEELRVPACIEGFHSISFLTGRTLKARESDKSLITCLGTVCDDGFDDNSADAICRELGYSFGHLDWTYGSKWSIQNNFEITLDDVSCESGEWSSCSCLF